MIDMHHSFVLLLTVTVTQVSCSLMLDDGDVGQCQESSWLCRQLALLQSSLSEQQRLNDLQNALISEQNRKMDQYHLEIAQLKDLTHKQNDELSHLNAKVTKQDSLIQKFCDEIVTMKNQQHDFESESVSLLSQQNSSNSAHDKLVVRADDGGPLEVVVNQLSQQMTAMDADVQALKNSNQQLQAVNHLQDANIVDARTSTYTRWGSSRCPADAQLVYSGVVGGTWYSESGGGTNYLCLTMSPVFIDHIATNNYAVLHGAEYETQNDAHHNMDPVCAVCRSSHATTVMIPGTNVCTSGWTKQYDGYLMAEREHNPTDMHYPSEFVCVDSSLEGRPGSNADMNGRLFYFTVTNCGSLPCGPYEDGKFVSCVVCSK
jgi:hypothetical protein